MAPASCCKGTARERIAHRHARSSPRTSDHSGHQIRTFAPATAHVVSPGAKNCTHIHPGNKTEVRSVTFRCSRIDCGSTDVRRYGGCDLEEATMWLGAEGRDHQSNAHLAGVVSPEPVPALTLRRAGTESGPGRCGSVQHPFREPLRGCGVVPLFASVLSPWRRSGRVWRGSLSVNRVGRAMSEACRLHPQLRTYRCVAAHRRFGPIAK